MDKKILPSSPAGQLSVEHIPPRLVEAKQGWYFVFYQVNPESGALERHRKSYNLGRISSIKARRDRAKELLQYISELMKAGYPWVNGRLVYELHRFVAHYKSSSPAFVSSLVEGKLGEVVMETAEIAARGLKRNTARTYRNRAKLFVAWLDARGWADWPVSNFKTQHAMAYMDEARLRVNNNTYNNYRRELGVVFAAIKKRGFIKENPFSEVSTVAKVKKKRRAFEPYEAQIMLAEAYKTDYWLFLVMILHCFELFRKTECLSLRFRNFNLKEGFIALSEDDSKNHGATTTAIPDEILPFFLDKRFTIWPANYLVFGQAHKPHPSIPAGDNTYMELHRDMLLRLQESGDLLDITGLSLYSWKDTGMTLLADLLPPMKLKDHARHSTIETTLRYYHGKNMVPEVKTAQLSILDGLKGE